MKDVCAHIIRNALPRVHSLIMNARVSLRSYKVADAERLLKLAEQSLMEVDRVFSSCPMRNGECCLNGREGKRSWFSFLRRKKGEG